MQRKPGTFRRRLVVMAFAVLTPAVAVVAVLVERSAERAIADAAARQLAETSRTLASAARTYDAAVVRTLQSLQSNASVQRLDAGRLSPILAAVASADWKIRALQVLDAEGNEVARSDPWTPGSARAKDWFQLALSGERMVRRAVANAPGGGVVTYAAPVRRDGEVVGVVAATVPMDPIARAMAPSVLRGQAGSFAVLDAAGRPLIAPAADGAVSLNAVAASPPALRAVAARGEAHGGFHYAGGTWDAHAVPMDNGWTVVAAQPAPAWSRLRWGTAGAAAAVLAVGLFLAWRLARCAAKPLTRLAEVAPLIVEGRRGRAAYIGHDGEVGDVAWCIDRLATDLDDARLNVERVVADRTRDLRDANALLDRAHAQASSANAAKDEFLANMSHEIRTPLTAIIGYAELLIDLDMEEQERVKALHAIQYNGEHLLEVINDVLDLSKMDADMMELEALECQPVALILDVLSLMGARAREKKLDLQVAYVTPIPEKIHTDPTRLRQILINLIGNAIKFTPEGSVRLSVGMAEDPGPDQIPLLRFDVSDTGVGIAADQVGQLFQPFKQADPTMSRKFGGTGLGLVISKRLAKLLGGDIAVTSALGEGTTFTVTVRAGPIRGIRMLNPAELNTAVVAEVPLAAEERAALNLHGYRVLVADDNPENGRIIAKMLDSAGALCTVADSGRVALHAAMEGLNAMAPFDVILMDMQMAEVNGYEATKRLRTLGYPSPIVALTANAMSTDRDKCLAVGCDDYAVKPIDRRKLIALVRKWCVAGIRPVSAA